jgi:hypothetical protein
MLSDTHSGVNTDAHTPDRTISLTYLIGNGLLVMAYGLWLMAYGLWLMAYGLYIIYLFSF